MNAHCTGNDGARSRHITSAVRAHTLRVRTVGDVEIRWRVKRPQGAGLAAPSTDGPCSQW